MARDAGDTGRLRTGYRQIATILIDEIRAGVWSVGEKLPTESALVGRFAVSRKTVREAMRDLQDIGYLSKRRGARSEVIRSAPDPNFLNSIRSIEELLDYLHSAHGLLLSTDRVVLLNDQAARLDCAVGSEWMRFQLILRREPGASPFCYAEVYVDPKFADGVESLAQPYDICVAIEKRYGVIIGRVIQQIEADWASDGVALKLQTPVGAPVLLARTTFYATDGAIVEIALAHFAAGRYRMKMMLDRRRAAAA